MTWPLCEALCDATCIYGWMNADVFWFTCGINPSNSKTRREGGTSNLTDGRADERLSSVNNFAEQANPNLCNEDEDNNDRARELEIQTKLQTKMKLAGVQAWSWSCRGSSWFNPDEEDADWHEGLKHVVAVFVVQVFGVGASGIWDRFPLDWKGLLLFSIDPRLGWLKKDSVVAYAMELPLLENSAVRWTVVRVPAGAPSSLTPCCPRAIDVGGGATLSSSPSAPRAATVVWCVILDLKCCIVLVWWDIWRNARSKFLPQSRKSRFCNCNVFGCAGDGY